MRLTTAMNHEHRLLSRLAEMCWWARHCGWTHSRIMAEFKSRVTDDPAWRRVPQWVRERVHNRYMDWNRSLYQPNLSGAELDKLLADAAAGREVKQPPYLVSRLRVDGEIVTSDQICAMRAAGDEDAWYRVEGAHVWTHTGEPFGDGGWKRTMGND